MSPSGPVLIIEDDPNDALLLQTALGELQLLHPLIVLANGKEALNYLSGQGPFADRTAYPLPVLVLLDLKLPLLDGFDVLRWLQKHPQLKACVPVVVMTADPHPGVAGKVVTLGADQLMQKPLGYEKLVEQMRLLKQRWLEPKD
jgi:CheY-like chemotaxis protein